MNRKTLVILTIQIEPSRCFAKRILQAALVAIARLPLFLASRFYIEFIINANTISVISYTYAHISGESLCMSLHSIIYKSELETRLERNPSKIIFPPRLLKIISDAIISIGLAGFFFFVYTFTSFVTSIDTLIHPRTSTIGIDETGKSYRYRVLAHL
ncbi:hypothetical protein ACS0PU_010752 [Formica fusca]